MTAKQKYQLLKASSYVAAAAFAIDSAAAFFEGLYAIWRETEEGAHFIFTSRLPNNSVSNVTAAANQLLHASFYDLSFGVILAGMSISAYLLGAHFTRKEKESLEGARRI
ncbi:MAG: hypothetical protein ACP5T4_00435 [Candidatus Micrarchaeia archaeon]